MSRTYLVVSCAVGIRSCAVGYQYQVCTCQVLYYRVSKPRLHLSGPVLQGINTKATPVRSCTIGYQYQVCTCQVLYCRVSKLKLTVSFLSLHVSTPGLHQTIPIPLLSTPLAHEAKVKVTQACPDLHHVQGSPPQSYQGDV